MSRSIQISDLPPHLQHEIQSHFDQNSIIFGTRFPPPPPPPQIFFPFPRLPIELQTYVWKLVFLHNTTYNTGHHRSGLSQFTHTNTSAPDNEVSIYAVPDHGSRPGPNWAIEIAEGKTAFWAETWVRDPNRCYRDQRHVRLVEPAEEDTRITLVSGIPVLLQTCYLARRTALETFRQLLVAYRVPGFRAPWPNMVKAIDHALEMQHRSTFHPFPRLPLDLQKYIWRLAFLRNTTFITTRYYETFQVFCTTQETDYPGNDSSTIYSLLPHEVSPDGQTTTPRHASNYKARRAEEATAFWAYGHRHHLHPHNPPRKDCHITLPYPDEDHIPDNESVVAGWLESRKGMSITFASKIPHLLQSSRLARQTALETFREVLAGYQIPGRRTPLSLIHI